MARKGQFKKGGGRVGGGSKSRALVKYRTNTITKYRTRAKPKKQRRSRSRRGGGGSNLLHLGITAGVVGLALSDKSPVPQIKATLLKVPGAKTFGPEVVFGGLALGVDRFFYKSKWLRAAGAVAVVLGALKLGQQNTAFKWLGDVGGDGEDDYIADVD